jgi:hypothetical protein
VVSRPLPAAPLVLCRWYLNRDVKAATRGVFRCATQLHDRDAQADARDAIQVLGRGAKAVAPGAARSAPQMLDRGSKAVARGAARCALRVLDLGAQAAALDTASTSSGRAGCCPRRCSWCVAGNHRDFQAVALGVARCAQKALDRGARAGARVTALVLDRGAQAVARGAKPRSLSIFVAGT